MGTKRRVKFRVGEVVALRTPMGDIFRRIRSIGTTGDAGTMYEAESMGMRAWYLDKEMRQLSKRERAASPSEVRK